jgi:hypothetical protein
VIYDSGPAPAQSPVPAQKPAPAEEELPPPPPAEMQQGKRSRIYNPARYDAAYQEVVDEEDTASSDADPGPSRANNRARSRTFQQRGQ